MQGRPSLVTTRAGSLLLALPAFASAWLLFAVEPMLGKLLLPVLGGSPATWAATLVAFQLLLLGGYAYAYLGARYLDVRRQALLHAAALLAAVVWVIQGRAGGAPSLPGLPPALAVTWLVLARVGLPYVVLASTAPLLVRWSRGLGQPSGALYAVSNAGSLAGLVSYPLLLERFVGLPAQFALWSAGFLLFGLVILPACLASARLRAGVGQRGDDTARATPREKLFWLGCSLLPSALLLAVTNYITVDVAATPVLWAMPLVIYLLSFVAAFSSWNQALRGPALVACVIGSGWLGLVTLGQGAVPLFAQIVPALLALLGASLACHGELALARPAHAEHSGYYLTLALGGVLGGALVSLAAPLVFSDFYELEVALVATFALLLLATRRSGAVRIAGVARLVLYLGCGLCPPLLLGEGWLRHSSTTRDGTVLERRRSFLGPLRVVDTAQGRLLTHGRIQHGLQLRAPHERTPTLYFGVDTAVGRVLETVKRDGGRRLGVVGLGVGTLASYGRAGDSLRFYELDPNVIELARRDFTFLRDSLASVTVAAGDGRLALAREAPHDFDVLVLDAFSSDSVPVHLLTREAFEVYRRQLAPDGVLLANVSNRHLDVERVVRASAGAVGLSSAIFESWGQGRSGSGVGGHGVHVVWAVMAADPALIRSVTTPLAAQVNATPAVLWTDSRASVLSVLR